MTSFPVTRFEVTWDRATKIVSRLTVVLFLGIMVSTRSPWFAVFLVPILALAYAYSPRGYVVTNGLLTIERPIGNVRIPLTDLQEVRAADQLSPGIKLWGSGGLCGYYGLYRTSGLGKCTWYVTDKSKCVVVRTATKTIVVSPDKADSFLTAMRTVAAVTSSAAPLFSVDEGNSVGNYIGGAIGVAAVALVGAAWFYSPGSPGYTLTPDSLSIHDRFYPVTLRTAAVDVPDIRIVNIDNDKDWKPTLRVGGFSNPYYKAGWFLVSGGKRVRLYRAAGQQLVLLPPKGDGNAVLYEVSEPERFIAEVRREWLPAR